MLAVTAVAGLDEHPLAVRAEERVRVIGAHLVVGGEEDIPAGAGIEAGGFLGGK